MIRGEHVRFCAQLGCIGGGDGKTRGLEGQRGGMDVGGEEQPGEAKGDAGHGRGRSRRVRVNALEGYKKRDPTVVRTRDRTICNRMLYH